MLAACFPGGCGLRRWYLGRRSLLGRRLCLISVLGLPRKCFRFHRGQFLAVAEELTNHRALGLNRVSLLYDQKGHQTVRDEKKDHQQRKHGMLGSGIRWRTGKQGSHESPELRPERLSGTLGKCSYGTNVEVLCM